MSPRFSTLVVLIFVTGLMLSCFLRNNEVLSARHVFTDHDLVITDVTDHQTRAIAYLGYVYTVRRGHADHYRCSMSLRHNNVSQTSSIASSPAAYV